MPIELPKTYDPKEAQQKWLAFWEERGYFRADPAKGGEPYAIVIPPPNVTGALHMGHALNITLQDVLVRWRRMQGRNTLWMPGTDHAGIATQAVVERLLMQTEKKTRHDLGREALVAKIWEWKDKYETRILGQLKQIGASCDWSRTRFTLDETCAKAVRETFFNMFRDGYIYRGKRLVNWDTQLQTSVADDETYTETTKGGFWTFQYPVVDEPEASATGQPTYIQFSTTRPETMLGDTALCVHPDDERYKHLIGLSVLQPHTQREIPIIADGLLADPKLGTGCVKVTPAHDPNDYACWQRNPQIAIINILNPDGTIAAGFGEYSGLDRTKARAAVTAKMEELGLFIDKQDRDIPLPYSDRSKTPIEPFLSDQWFVKMTDRDDDKSGLAQSAIDAVTSGRVKFFPERYAKTYLDWLGEKRDWCVSRQLWWGHRIPVWTKRIPTEGLSIPDVVPDGTSTDTRWTGQELRAEVKQFAEDNVYLDRKAGYFELLITISPGHPEFERQLESVGFTQDPDVLDTWFSSALWPHSTLGWPEKTPEMERYYPTNTLVTSRDIISLWVARMVITGVYNTGEVPFADVYIHPQLQDAFGERMSKTTGNGIDPLDIIERYGADSLRYQMLAIAGDTQDSRMPVFNVCPSCDTLVATKAEHLRGRTKKLACPSCKVPFRPGGPWTSEDPELKTAKQASDRFDLGRNFANKLWNATRFILMNLEGYTPGAIDPATRPGSQTPATRPGSQTPATRPGSQTPATKSVAGLYEAGFQEPMTIEDRWIVSRLATTANAVTAALEAYRFADVAKLVYEFAWSEFCDWYIEMSKSRRSDPVCQRVLVGVLDGILRLVHPVMPFLAESLWEYLGQAAPERGFPTPIVAEESVCIAAWPNYPPTLIDASTETSIAMMQDLVRGIRELRNRYQIDKATLDVVVRCADPVANDLNAMSAFVKSLGQLNSLTYGPTIEKPKQAGSFVTNQFEAYVSLVGLIDAAAEIKRLEKQIAEKQKSLSGTLAKLSNESFVKNAPPEVLTIQKNQAADAESQIRILEANLAELRQG